MKLRLGLLVALSLAAAGCSSSDCEETRTCGGGSDGGTVGKACETSPDCDDGLACNGEEQCIAKKCQAGTPACTTSDPDHCEATCTESSGGPVCAEQGRDADGDTHRDALCAKDPGDDCDDAHDTAYPGASEVCDGFDNDCNGKADTEDGLSLFGTNGKLRDPIGAASLIAPSIAWATEIGNFGVAYTSDDGAEARPGFQLASPGGSPIGPSVQVATPSPSKVGFVRIAWNGTTFGLVWDDAGAGNSNVYFATVDTSGKLGAIQTLAATPDDEIIPSVAAVGKRWIVTWQREISTTEHELNGHVLNSDGTPTSALPTVIAPSFSGVGIGRIAGRTGQVLMAWSEGTSASDIKYSLLSDLLAPQSSGTWSSAGGSQNQFVQVASTESGEWLGSWQGGAAGNKEVTFARLSAAGAKGCSDAVADGSDLVGPIGVAGLGAGAVVGVADGSGDSASVRLVTVGSDCKPTQSAAITSSAYSPGQAPEAVGDVDASATAIGVVWSERTAGKGSIYIRALGPALCDAPK